MKYVYWRGERVRVASPNKYTESHTDVGQVGTVLTDSFAPWIVFDEPTRYVPPTTRIPTRVRGWKVGHMDCIACDHLELVSEPRPVTDAYLYFERPDPDGTESE